MKYFGCLGTLTRNGTKYIDRMHEILFAPFTKEICDNHMRIRFLQIIDNIACHGGFSDSGQSTNPENSFLGVELGFNPVLEFRHFDNPA